MYWILCASCYLSHFEFAFSITVEIIFVINDNTCYINLDTQLVCSYLNMNLICGELIQYGIYETL